MNYKNRILLLSFLLMMSTLTSCQERSIKKVGGPCEGCEAIFEYKNKVLNPVDTLPGFQQNEPKLKITGTVFEKDGKTPAENVIIYIYHTNRQGIYETKGNETGWDRRHGFIRGWIRTGKNGQYTFYTFRPAAYPNADEPEHIHITIKEPHKNEYYMDDYLFNDDPLLTQSRRNRLENRGGSGIVSPKMEDGILTIKRNIILGKNIPDYD
ncbi:protocatechuate 3,4-dioxygenase beta subunit [Chryseobacterium defluvii]|uniref:Protocatechuate 3,4-dioxygenase beta subunit n=1 Tax=Chryseobacterium defluvii TaxID=160396 RepID=A0A840K918_9FLAO|nr:intradiol ring-cleavage dioxygenase [Chryseobacterium defluvii]MBB4805716.1 protocatechuate 3,4-dioxygenase beta subunit [Chryseobacterium defluvii]